MNPKAKVLLCNLLMLLAVFVAGGVSYVLANSYLAVKLHSTPGGPSLIPAGICFVLGLVLGFLQCIKRPCRFRFDISQLVFAPVLLVLGLVPVMEPFLMKYAPALASASSGWLTNDISVRIFPLLAGGFLLGAFYGAEKETR